MNILEFIFWIIAIYLGLNLLIFLISIAVSCYLLIREERKEYDR